MHKTITLFLFSFFLSVLAWADQLIIEPDMGRTPIMNAIHAAQHSVKLVMYGFTDQSLLDAIIRKHEEGKTVSIILENTPYKAAEENNKIITQLKKHDIAKQGEIPPFRLIHQKTLLIDNRQAIIMTFNFTHSTFKNERNFALIVDDPQKIKQIAAIFSADWHHVPIENTTLDLIVSPNDSRKKLMLHVAKAQRCIRIYAQHINDYNIVGALAKAAKRRVSVQLLLSAKLHKKQENYLARAGVKIHYSKNLIIHAKAFSIDDQLAIIGSINLTRASLDNNRELSVVTRDPTVIKQLNTTFIRDWNQNNALLGQ